MDMLDDKLLIEKLEKIETYLKNQKKYKKASIIEMVITKMWHLEKKDKIIDKMAEYLASGKSYMGGKQEIIKYFEESESNE